MAFLSAFAEPKLPLRNTLTVRMLNHTSIYQFRRPAGNRLDPDDEVAVDRECRGRPDGEGCDHAPNAGVEVLGDDGAARECCRLHPRHRAPRRGPTNKPDASSRLERDYGPHLLCGEVADVDLRIDALRRPADEIAGDRRRQPPPQSVAPSPASTNCAALDRFSPRISVTFVLPLTMLSHTMSFRRSPVLSRRRNRLPGGVFRCRSHRRTRWRCDLGRRDRRSSMRRTDRRQRG
jgi:hypothetical protein